VLAPAASFTDFVLALHILGVVAGFGATFAYPIFLSAGLRMDPAVTPWFFRMTQLITRRLIYPGLVLVLVCGIYLAAQEHQFHAFYVQWGFAAVIIIGGVEGGVMAPRTRTLIGLAERDLAGAPAAASGDRGFSFGSEYQGVLRQLSIGGTVQSLVVVLTVVFMALHLGA
jgi:hypothetical protein